MIFLGAAFPALRVCLGHIASAKPGLRDEHSICIHPSLFSKQFAMPGNSSQQGRDTRDQLAPNKMPYRGQPFLGCWDSVLQEFHGKVNFSVHSPLRCFSGTNLGGNCWPEQLFGTGLVRDDIPVSRVCECSQLFWGREQLLCSDAALGIADRGWTSRPGPDEPQTQQHQSPYQGWSMDPPHQEDHGTTESWNGLKPISFQSLQTQQQLSHESRGPETFQKGVFPNLNR